MNKLQELENKDADLQAMFNDYRGHVAENDVLLEEGHISDEFGRYQPSRSSD